MLAHYMGIMLTEGIRDCVSAVKSESSH